MTSSDDQERAATAARKEATAARKEATAARPPFAGAVGPVGAMLAPELAGDLGLGDGDAAALVTAAGRVWSTISIAPAGAVPVDAVALGGSLWAALSVNPGQGVSVHAAGKLPKAERVELVTPFQLTQQAYQQVLCSLRESGASLYEGARLVAEGAGSGTTVNVLVASASPSPASLSPDTAVVLRAPDPALYKTPVALTDVGGAAATIDRLRCLVVEPLTRPQGFRALGIRPPKGVLLHGPPGTGKTLLCRALANTLGVNVISVASTELIGTASGETEANLRVLFSKAVSHAPTLLLIDEFDVVATDRERLASQGDVRAVSQLLSLMDGLAESDGVVLVGTTNRLSAVDRAFRRPGRFEDEVYVSPPDEAARREIIDIHTRNMPLGPGVAEKLEQVAARARGYTGADLMHLTREAGLAAVRRTGTDKAEGAVVSLEDFDVALERSEPSLLRDVAVPKAELSWEEISGLAEQRERLLALAEAAFGTAAGRGVAEGALLTGPPGTGKTLLAKALVERLGANLISVEGTRIFNHWLGESEEAVRRLFRLAREASPAVILLDQVDSLAPRRGGVAKGMAERADERVIAALLFEIDRAKSAGGVFVVGTTNRLEAVDPSLLRSGRLGAHVEIPLPDERRREGLVSDQAARLDVSLAASAVDELVARTEGWTAADVVGRIRRFLAGHAGGRLDAADAGRLWEEA